MLISSVPQARDTLHRKSTIFVLIAKIFQKSVLLVFWHDIVYIALLHFTV